MMSIVLWIASFLIAVKVFIDVSRFINRGSVSIGGFILILILAVIPLLNVILTIGLLFDSGVYKISLLSKIGDFLDRDIEFLEKRKSGE